MIKNNWVTENTHLKEGEFFVDEKRFMPYAMWHHEHPYEELQDGKVLMTDIVNFKLPMGFIGDLLAGFFVKNNRKVRQTVPMMTNC